MAIHGLQGKAIWVIVLAVFAFGALFVESHRLLWTDFTLVIFALFLHPTVERGMKRAAGWLVQAFPKVWRGMVFGPGKEGHKA